MGHPFAREISFKGGLPLAVLLFAKGEPLFSFLSSAGKGSGPRVPRIDGHQAFAISGTGAIPKFCSVCSERNVGFLAYLSITGGLVRVNNPPDYGVFSYLLDRNQLAKLTAFSPRASYGVNAPSPAQNHAQVLLQSCPQQKILRKLAPPAQSSSLRRTHDE